jgi:hypothetical protein
MPTLSPQTETHEIKCLLLPDTDVTEQRGQHTLAESEQRDKSKFRAWLSPPDPSINHNTACDIHHNGTASWFIQDSRFREWKENGGSLLWIRGNRMFLSLS